MSLTTFPSRETVPPEVPAEPKKRSSWRMVVVTIGAALAALGAACTLTYAITRQAAQPLPTPQDPADTPAGQAKSYEQAKATERICLTFHDSVRGGNGPLIDHGQLNATNMTRALDSVEAVQDGLGPAVPPEITAAAHLYAAATLDMVKGALDADLSINDLNKRVEGANTAIDNFASVCGLR